MYRWLADTLDAGAQIVTANRRLARHLADTYAEQKVRDGFGVWTTPSVLAWPDWLARLLDTASEPHDLPIRLHSSQCDVIWERAFRRQVDQPLVRIGMLVRQAREAWDRLQAWEVPLAECRRTAQNVDQRLFARVAEDYAARLERENWLDGAGMSRLATRLVAAGRVQVPTRLAVAGFDRMAPVAVTLFEALRKAGTDVQIVDNRVPGAGPELAGFDTVEAELRSAGAWARTAAQAMPEARIGIVVTNLAEDPGRYVRLVRDGAVPGWQNAPLAVSGQVNVSLGRRLTDYPAIAIALLALRWLVDDLRARDVSTLLLTSLLGGGCGSGRARLDVRLRRLPDRYWTPAMILGVFTGREPTADAADWLDRIAALDDTRGRLPQTDSPSGWAGRIDRLLTELGWPGTDGLDSEAFQLVNRWRDLLNDFSALELVCPTLDMRNALQRLGGMAADAIYQSESRHARIHVLGPLEAAGMRFDRLWVSGLSAGNWPPAGRSLPLLAVQLQRRYGMPDADAGDTLMYARRVLQRLADSAAGIVMSFARSDGLSSEHVPTELLRSIDCRGETSCTDPGWYAGTLCKAAARPIPVRDAIPSVESGEVIAGGAATLQKQIDEPFSAFVSGRLGVRPLQPIMQGLDAGLRGKHLHDALHRLYADLPSHATLAAWKESECAERIRKAVRTAYSKHCHFADGVLRELYELEQRRAEVLLASVVELDASRTFDAVHGVELSFDADVFGAALGLRVDRIDKLCDGSVVILDYKTGARKSLLDRSGQPRDMQLIVYANAVDEKVAGIALVNVDPRVVNIDGAGIGFDAGVDWWRKLQGWSRKLESAVADLLSGDVRINGAQTIEQARPLSLLSRFHELRHGD